MYLENGEHVYFTENNLQVTPPKTTLSEFFDLCTRDQFLKTFLYIEVLRFKLQNQQEENGNAKF
jgi:hypothetical protein